MRWHELKSSELERVDRDTPVVVPLGACEQHGRHLPLHVDTFQVSRIAEDAERRLGDEALFLPPIWLGSSSHHLDFCGTVSVPPSVYSRMVRSVAESILRAGFTRVVFLNGHGGNRVPVAQALTEFIGESDEADAAHLVLATWWELNPASMDPQRLGAASPRLMHACEYETSLMLAIRPDLVAMQDAAGSRPVLCNEWVDTENDDASRVRVFKRTHRVTATGSVGVPKAATAEKGRLILDAVTTDLVRFIRDLRHWPKLEPLRPSRA